MKTYCVHVYEAAHKYEDVKARTPEEAEAKVMHHFFNTTYDQISNVEVMRQCECGYDKDVENTKCDECGKKL